MRFIQQLRGSPLLRLLLLALLFTKPLGLMANEDGVELSRVHAIKVAFILNIARFVSWPAEVFANDNDALHLCMYRTNAYGKALDELTDKKVGKRSIEVTVVKKFDADANCEILVIPEPEIKAFTDEMQGSLDRPVLTIADHTGSDINSYSRQGIILTLVREGSRIGFEIDPWQARNANIRMSSELLKLARIVGKAF